MVEKLLSLNPQEQIIVLDNESKYPPLLDWYQKIQDQIEIRFLKNEGHLALWTTGLDKELGDFFVYTDSDIVLPNKFPKNWKEVLLEKLSNYPEFRKIGPGLKIEDLPDHYVYKKDVIHHETRWWLRPLEQDLFRAQIDTTFSLMKNFGTNCYPAIRICSEDMLTQHHPWYLDLSNLDEEEQYYLDHLGECVTTRYSKKHKKPEIEF